jgi:hypothetical protein
MKADAREWDEQQLRMCLYPHDVEEVLKIRPMQHERDDFMAWYYERSRIFTVRSAYRLAAEEKRRREGLDAGSSGATDGRSMYKDLWNADVPAKMRIFAWKLATDGIAMLDKKSKSVEWCRLECAKSSGMELKLDIMLSSGVRRLLPYGKR